MKAKTISVVVRTYNEAQFLPQLFATLDSQEGVTADVELIVVDSGSTDGTVDIARARNACLIEIPKETFDYSDALNRGISASHGQVIAILSAHAIPCSANWLELMHSHFADERVAGVFSRQEPWPNAYWREVVRLRQMFAHAPQVFDAAHNPGTVPFSNAASCIRRAIWEQRGFVLPAAEDIEWATWAVANGHTIVYEPRVSVFHSHNETSRQSARRLIDLEIAADIQLRRRRRLPFTVRQGLGAAWRDAREIARYTSSTTLRSKLLADSLARTCWFVMDFARTLDSKQTSD